MDLSAAILREIRARNSVMDRGELGMARVTFVFWTRNRSRGRNEINQEIHEIHEKRRQNRIEGDSLVPDSRKIAEFQCASPFVCFVVSSVFIP